MNRAEDAREQTNGRVSAQDGQSITMCRQAAEQAHQPWWSKLQR